MFKKTFSKAFGPMALGSAAVLAGAMALAPQAAQAAPDGTITFNGKIITSTCTINAGTPNLTVTLPVVYANGTTLSAAGNVAGLTPFTFNLTACPTTPSGLQVASFFSGTNIITTGTDKGNLGNTGSATNVDVQLLNGDSTPIDLSGADASGQNSEYATISGTGTGTLNYNAQYYATGSAGAGTVTTSVEYTLVYQ